MFCLAIVGLSAWNSLSSIGLDSVLVIQLPVTVLSAITLILCLTSYFWIPEKIMSFATYVVFIFASMISALLIIGSGGVESPFIAFWMILGMFSGIFGVLGFLPILASSFGFVMIKYIENDFSNSTIVIALLSGLLPIIASITIWRNKSEQAESDENRNYKNLATELNEVTSKSEVVINAIGDGVMAIDSQGVIQLINPAAQNLIGWDKRDAVSLNYKSVLKLISQSDEPLDGTADPIRLVLNGNQEIRTNKLSIATSSDKRIMISLVVSPVGEVGSGVIAVFRDITKETLEEREQAEFISTASHEMRTPVASIEGYLGLALNPRTAQVDDRARDYILKAHASAEHLGRLFQDLLDVAKSEDGRLSNKPKVINIVNFLHDVVQGLSQKAVDKGLRLIYKPMPDNSNEKHIAPAYSVHLDNDHIREVVNNLVENAIKYTPAGEIVVDVSGDDDHVVISVQDSGVGIPAEDLTHLFQKFYRVENKSTNEIGGTGLGLYLCRKLTEIMGGRIWAESVYGKGSTFFLELPRIGAREAEVLLEQESINQQNIVNGLSANNPQITTDLKPVVLSNPSDSTQQIANDTPIEKSTNSVPRGQALTPDQIAAYVAKQRVLAQQQVAEPQTQAKSIPIQDRDDIK